MMENKSLSMQVENMKTIIAAKDETVKAQNTIIQLFRAQMDNAVSRDSDRATTRGSDDGYYYILEDYDKKHFVSGILCPNYRGDLFFSFN